MPINKQETTISYSRDSQEVTVWTSDRTVMTKLDRLCETAPDYYRLTETANNYTGNSTQTGVWEEKIKFGGGQAHNNMPPYLVVYMWKRVS